MFPLAATWHDVADGILPFLLVVVLPLQALLTGAVVAPILYKQGRRRLALLLNLAALGLFLWLGSCIFAFLQWFLYKVEPESFVLHMLQCVSMALALFAAVEVLCILWLRQRR